MDPWEQETVKAKLCLHAREEDGARCVLNKHPDRPQKHGYAFAVDPRIATLTDLIERLTRSEKTVYDLRDEPGPHHDSGGRFTRLSGKAEGIRLARSYAEEALREVRRG